MAGGGQGGRGNALLFHPSLPIRAASTPTVLYSAHPYGEQSTGHYLSCARNCKHTTHAPPPIVGSLARLAHLHPGRYTYVEDLIWLSRLSWLLLGTALPASLSS